MNWLLSRCVGGTSLLSGSTRDLRDPARTGCVAETLHLDVFIGEADSWDVTSLKKLGVVAERSEVAVFV